MLREHSHAPIFHVYGAILDELLQYFFDVLWIAGRSVQDELLMRLLDHDDEP